MTRVRKALIAGAGAAGGALWAGLQADVPDSELEWLALLGVAASAGLLAGFATWRVPNAAA